MFVLHSGRPDFRSKMNCAERPYALPDLAVAPALMRFAGPTTALCDILNERDVIRRATEPSVSSDAERPVRGSSARASNDRNGSLPAQGGSEANVRFFTSYVQKQSFSFRPTSAVPAGPGTRYMGPNRLFPELKSPHAGRWALKAIPQPSKPLPRGTSRPIAEQCEPRTGHDSRFAG
jgi:hypothetical protein